MKVLMISTDCLLFDADSPVRLRLHDQAALATELHVIVFTPKGERFKVLHEGKQFTIYPTASTSKWMYLPDAYALAKEILAAKPRKGKWLITTQDPFETGALGYVLARKFHLPLHLQLHTDPFSLAWRHERFTNRLRFFIALFLLKHAAGIRVVSERVRSKVCELGIPEARITKVPIMVDVDHFMNAIPSFDLHHSYLKFGRIILSVGRLQPEKNFHGLIRAFARLKRTHEDTMLLIVGSGPLRERLVTLARSFGLHDAVVILPWARDVASYYKTCDIYVQPSLYEGWGMAVIEAMASGTPVVMTDVGCAGEVVRSGETGLVVPVQNDEALTAALGRLFDDQQLRSTLATQGQAEVKKLATKAETLALYEASWENALKQYEKK